MQALVNEKTKYFLFIEKNTGKPVEIPGINYKQAEKKLNKMIESKELSGDWRYDSCRSV